MSVEIGEGLDAVYLRGCDERGDAGPGASAFVVAGEERILSRQGQFPFILPMSGRFHAFTIGGTRILALKFVSFAHSSGAMGIL